MPKKIPKLLSPVRDETSFRSALQAGAEAVYFGLGELNMRASSKGIDLERLALITKLAHKRGVEVFITLNTIIYDQELKKLKQILQKVKKAKVDAVIAWDFAVIEECRKQKIPLHISTQASVSNIEAAKFYEKLGAKSIILARELNLKQIKAIRQKIKCKLEIFCHGAMCVSISGRCFLSQFLHNKSANRGECFHLCRREYKIIEKKYKKELTLGSNYILSPKDLCTLRILDKVVATGADYLKIEGRGRSPEYIYIVTKAYKTALEALKKNQYTEKLQDQLIKQVSQVYNRGFSQGFFLGMPGKNGWVKKEHNQATEKKEYLGKITNYFKKIKVLEMILHSGTIKDNDLLQIQGAKTGIKRIKVKNPKFHQKGEITFFCKEVARKKDEVYKVINSLDKK